MTRVATILLALCVVAIARRGESSRANSEAQLRPKIDQAPREARPATRIFARAWRYVALCGVALVPVGAAVDWLWAHRELLTALPFAPRIIEYVKDRTDGLPLSDPGQFALVIPRLVGDVGDNVRQALSDRLSGVRGVALSPLSRDVSAVTTLTSQTVATAMPQLEDWMRRSRAQALLWGIVQGQGDMQTVRLVWLSASLANIGDGVSLSPQRLFILPALNLKEAANLLAYFVDSQSYKFHSRQGESFDPPRSGLRQAAVAALLGGSASDYEGSSGQTKFDERLLHAIHNEEQAERAARLGMAVAAAMIWGSGHFEDRRESIRILESITLSVWTQGEVPFEFANVKILLAEAYLIESAFDSEKKSFGTMGSLNGFDAALESLDDAKRAFITSGTKGRLPALLAEEAILLLRAHSAIQTRDLERVRSRLKDLDNFHSKFLSAQVDAEEAAIFGNRLGVVFGSAANQLLSAPPAERSVWVNAAIDHLNQSLRQLASRPFVPPTTTARVKVNVSQALLARTEGSAAETLESDTAKALTQARSAVDLVGAGTSSMLAVDALSAEAEAQRRLGKIRRDPKLLCDAVGTVLRAAEARPYNVLMFDDGVESVMRELVSTYSKDQVKACAEQYNFSSERALGLLRQNDSGTQ